MAYFPGQQKNWWEIMQQQSPYSFPTMKVPTGKNPTGYNPRGMLPNPQQPPATPKNQKAAIIMGALSDIFRGQDPTQNTIARQQQFMVQQERDRQLAEQEKIRQAIINDPRIAQSQKEIVAAFPQVYTQSLLTKPAKPDLLRLGIYDTSGNQVGTVLRSNTEKIAEMEGQGYLVGNLSSPQTTPKGSDNDAAFDVIKNRNKATGQLIIVAQDLSQQFKDNPNSALAIGGTTQFVDGIIKNVDAGLNILGRKEDSVAFKEFASKGISEEGSDFTSRINEVSRETGVAESQIRDLAYLFAAARGQEGRGLSDKDYENALQIVSGGVGAENRVAVLENVANRLRSQAMYDLNYEKQFYSGDADMMARFGQLPELPIFKNPFSVQGVPINTVNQSANDPLGIRIP